MDLTSFKVYRGLTTVKKMKTAVFLTAVCHRTDFLNYLRCRAS